MSEIAGRFQPFCLGHTTSKTGELKVLSTTIPVLFVDEAHKAFECHYHMCS